MLENVPTPPTPHPPPPYRHVPLRTATHHTHGTNQIHRIFLNDLGGRFVEIRILLDRGRSNDMSV